MDALRFSVIGRLLDAREQILNGKPDRDDFLGTVLCQVGISRRRTGERTFEVTAATPVSGNFC